jgi:hypothetical protein
MMTTTTPVTDSGIYSRAAHKNLVGDELWTRLAGRIRKDPTFQKHFAAEDDAAQQDWAERILDGTVVFLTLSADSTRDESFSPSPLVDIGWHCFILYTREYAEFCQQLAGRVIHHAPFDVPGVVYAHKGSTDKTRAALQVRGLPIDEPLWVGAADCVEEVEADCCTWCGPPSKN